MDREIAVISTALSHCTCAGRSVLMVPNSKVYCNYNLDFELLPPTFIPFEARGTHVQCKMIKTPSIDKYVCSIRGVALVSATRDLADTCSTLFCNLAKNSLVKTQTLNIITLLREVISLERDQN